MTDLDAVLGLDAEDLDGHTIEELEDYLDRDRLPADPTIDGSPSCQIALAALQRLKNATRALLDPTVREQRSRDDWVADAIGRISLEARAGRRFPLPQLEPGLDAVVTEGALRGLVRAIGDDVPGVLTGAVHLTTEAPFQTAALEIDVALIYGHPLAQVVENLRRSLMDVLPDHAPFDLERIDIRVVDVIDLQSDGPTT
jgi:hypothetical protein